MPGICSIYTLHIEKYLLSLRLLDAISFLVYICRNIVTRRSLGLLPNLGKAGRRVIAWRMQG